MLFGFPQGYFFIVGGNGKVLDVAGASFSPGAKVLAWSQKRTDNANQLWYHENGYLVNKNSGLVLDVASGLESGFSLCQFERKWITDAHNQRWGYHKGFIYCLARPDLVLDIAGAADWDGAGIIVYERKRGNDWNQQWSIEVMPYY